VAVISQIVVLLYGGLVHLIQITLADGPPYRWAPAWLAIYFTLLTVFDPLAAWLLVRRQVTGLYLAAFVLLSDATANAHATYWLPRSTATARVAQAVISLLA
jgi:hypothetical protein